MGRVINFINSFGNKCILLKNNNNKNYTYYGTDGRVTSRCILESEIDHQIKQKYWSVT